MRHPRRGVAGASPTATQLEQKSRELEAATAELRAANERLQELDRLKDDFISTVTHELRTPLTSIRALLARSCTTTRPRRRPSAQRFLGIIVKESERLTRLINQVLDLAQDRVGQRRVARSPRSTCASVIDEAVAATSRAVPASAASRSTLDLPDDVPPRARRPRPPDAGAAQPAVERRQVLRAGRRPRRGARSRATPDALRVDVRDNGPGIAAERPAA